MSGGRGSSSGERWRRWSVSEPSRPTSELQELQHTTGEPIHLCYLVRRLNCHGIKRQRLADLPR